MHEWYVGGFWFFGWIVFMILFWTVIGRFWWRGGPRSRQGWHDEGKDALDYLKERYAKGDITKEEYEKIKKDIVS